MEWGKWGKWNQKKILATKTVLCYTYYVGPTQSS